MDKASKMGKDSASGTFQLFIGKTLSSVIMAVGTIVLGIIILQADYGLYVIALIPATTIALFQDWGVGSAMTKNCAQLRAASKDNGELRQIIVSGLTFEVLTGVALSFFSFLIANLIAALLNKPESAPLIAVASSTVFLVSLFSAIQSIFVGFERMGLISIGLICQAIAQCILPVLLVYEGYGAYGAVVGYIFSMLVGCVVTIVLLYFSIFRHLDVRTKSLDIRKTLKPLLGYGIPLATATILSSLKDQITSFIMALVVTTSLIGNYKIATNFAVLLAFLTVPISTVLFPAFSKIDPEKELDLLKTVFVKSVKYASLFLMPATMAMLILSGPIISTLYGNKWFYAPSYLSLYVTNNFFVVLGILSIPSLLSAIGETKMLMKINLVTLLVAVPFSVILIPRYGIIGVIIVTVFAALPTRLYNVYWLRKRYGIKFEVKSLFGIFIASSIAGALTFLFLSLFSLASWIMLSIGIALFLLTFLVSAPLLGAINQTDIDNLRAMFANLGRFSKILEIPLTVIERLLKIMHVKSLTG